MVIHKPEVMRIYITLFFSISIISLHGQSQKAEVMQTINNVFIAMKTNDSTLAKSSFTEDAVLFTIFDDENGITQKRSNPATKLITAFGQPKEQIWSEPIWNEKVEIDGGLASVWVDYAFYVDQDFSHCGVDAFQLIKTSEGWKIFHLADTRRKADCQVPEEIKGQYK
jgi:hypothetical protein